MSRQFLVLWVLFGILFCSAIGQDEDFDDTVIEEEIDPEIVEEIHDDVPYTSPDSNPEKYYFAEHFDDIEQFNKRWVRSEAKKDGADEDIAKYDGVWSVEAPQRVIMKNDLGLVLKSKAKHAAISGRLNKPFTFSDKPLVVQYEVTLQDGQECGGSYIKLLTSGPETTNLKQFQDRTPYSIMFGPDKCGNDHKLHFIFKHTNPLNGSVEEKHCKKPRERIEEPFKDKQPHLYRLVLRPDNSFTISLDQRIVNEGSLLLDFTPPVNPPNEIADPNHVKPEDWDEREKIPDPEATKPLDWDENEPPQIPDPSAVKPAGWLDEEEEMIADETATKPEDWDTDMDGEWEAPLIQNPACVEAVGCGLWKAPFITNPNYKGKWRAPYISNPNYKGKWSARLIPNPDYFEDIHPFRMAPIAAVGIELWSMSQDILFDNILITNDEEDADNWAAVTFELKKKQIDKDAETLVNRLTRYTNENPWLWAVYTVAIGLPIALMLFYCCQSKDPERPSGDEPKKTDAVSPDDEELKSNEEPQYGEIKTKENDEKENDDEPEDDQEEEAEEEETEEVIPKPEETDEAPRKRKPRKE